MNKNTRITTKEVITVTIGLFMLLITIASATATVEYDWLTPSFSGEIIDEYPQQIRVVARGNETITNCILTVGSSSGNASIGVATAEVNTERKLKEGTHTVTINCTDTYNTYQETSTLEIDDMATINRTNEKNLMFTIWLAVMIALIIAYALIGNYFARLIISVLMLLTSLMIFEITKGYITYIPITVTSLILLYEAILGRDRK